MLLPTATSPSSFNCGFPARVSSKCPVYRSIRLRCYCGTSAGERDDMFYMRRCVELAKRAIGCTSPNPMVGCVIVRDGEVVGEGFHPKAGQPHAEVFALRDAGALAENATAYVSLEPCNHYGRTPPCTKALIQAKVQRVVVGMVDPNPIVASKGLERLQNSGISVTVGVEENLCRKLNEAYIHKMLTGRPFVMLRYSLSINGSFLGQLGKDAEECGGYYSKLLQENDGIILSSNSIVKNGSLPFSREPGAKQPLNIIIAGKGDSPLHLPIHYIGPDTKATIVLEKGASLDSETEAYMNLQSVDIIVLDQINLSSILDYCSSQGLCSIFLDVNDDVDFHELIVEGLEKRLVQKIVMDICPIWSSSNKSFLWDVRKKSVPVNDIRSVIVKESALVEGYFT